MKACFISLFLILAIKMSAQISYMYSDANMNSYTIKEFELRYDPIQKEESSSGMYSGGEAKVKVLSPYEFTQIGVMFEEAFSDSTAIIPKREMGSGLLIKYNKTKVEKKTILKFKSGTVLKIEEKLQSYL